MWSCWLYSSYGVLCYVKLTKWLRFGVEFFVYFTGPSTAIDTACSSSLLALENAFNAIRHGQCDAALVGGVNLLLKPNTSVQFMKLGMLSPDGACKSFDASGDIFCYLFIFWLL